MATQHQNLRIKWKDILSGMNTLKARRYNKVDLGEIRSGINGCS